MYDKLTDKTRKVISYARQEAQRLGHDYIGTEHLLLGILKERTGMAGTVLDRLGVDAAQVRQETEKATPAATERMPEGRQFPFKADAKKAFEYAVEEAGRLRHNYIGTEHLLVGLVQVEEGAAARALKACGVELKGVRNAIAGLISGEDRSSAPSPARIEARLQEVENLAAGRTDDQLIQAFRTVLAYCCDVEASAVAGGDFERAYSLRDLYERNMGLLRRLCNGRGD
jgi:ATP-dependent Clp protease ATP-binding subunit ClpA